MWPVCGAARCASSRVALRATEAADGPR
jgi:hypothetical protein